MTYSKKTIPNRHKKKRAHYSGVFIVCMAFLAFIVIGLTVSLSIRACSHHNNYTQEKKRYAEASTEPVDTKYEANPEASFPYEMPDSVVEICMPRPLEGVSEQIIRKMSYFVSYNKDTKIPNWVAWRLTAEHADGNYPRDNTYYEDEEVPSPRATNEDYHGSGWSRGHMCPAGDNKWDEVAMRESNLLTNICPQHASLNSGLWNVIERDCRKWAKKYGELYIVCGPVLLNREHETIGPNKVVVPEAFFKVILRLKPDPTAIGFVVRNNEGTKKRDHYINTVDEVERITGIDFFPSLPDEIENIVEANADINEWI